MCGIFGSSDFESYEKLFELNRERGTFANGSLYVALDDLYTRKNFKAYELSAERVWNSHHDYYMFLGHTQAPTGKYRKWKASTTHPFECGSWIVAHNGVLENFEELKTEYLPEHECPVDSSIIPALLEELFVGDDVYCMTEVSNLLKGTFACWVFSKHTHHTYLIRSGSTLYHDPDNCSFSSLPLEGVCEQSVDEGVIFQLTKEGSTPIGEFQSDSPFLIL